MRKSALVTAALAALPLLAACSDDLPPSAPAPPTDIGVCTAPSASVDRAPDAAPPIDLDSIFAAVGREFGVPAPLLEAIGYVETRWQMVQGRPEFPGQPVVYGLMGLKDGQLARGAALAGVSESAARTEPAANIRAAAALLSAYADELGTSRADLGAWAPAVARYSGIEIAAGRASYVHDAVYATLREGAAKHEAEGGFRATLTPTRVRADYAVPASITTAAGETDYPGAVWRASPNFNDRPEGESGRVALVIIHTCEGAYTGCWSWLANPDSRVSAHYVVNEDGTEITQLVRDEKRAWHIGSQYDCTLNANWECWRNGSSNNDFTIGIEHAGYASQSTWPEAQIDASAKLVCDLTERHGIPSDAIHIVGHAQLQPHNRSDPGANWPWTEYLERIDAHCGDPDTAGGIVIDSNNSYNDASLARLDVSANWTASDATPGHYGSGYYFAPTGADPDPATFRFHLDEPGSHTVEAWWTAGSNRSPTATFVATDENGERLGEVEIDQQKNGGRWNTLGTWEFTAGWNTIRLSREGPEGCVVIADAVRVR